ncbi:MAG: YkgJ family cysteine cluster protein [Deltaproteobacteria bacterium]|nr:YkgJ family cysteine cluster protein [Deltaproteobacteria bacterium]
MEAILERYGLLLREVDDWFQTCLEQHADQIQCRNGCSACCRGLFDITLLDAFYLKLGFDALPSSQTHILRQEASVRLKGLSQINPQFKEPWLLNSIPEDEWEELMPEDDETPCLLLSEGGGCLVYEYRPMTCRLNGIPLIDFSGEELFDEWCTLNFVQKDPRLLADLRFGFNELFTRELMLFREFTDALTGAKRNEVDLFIPAALLMDQDKIILAIKNLP